LGDAVPALAAAGQYMLTGRTSTTVVWTLDRGEEPAPA
ncbi:MAG: hypothetical protein QOC95_2626, partial [Thermoleophilaceae bacterium]|nr:hypothetical protein [Thermoleophilaceae bacterium]